MEEQPETPRILEELSKSNSAKPASRQQSVARKRFIVVLLVFSVLMSGIAGLGYQQWTLQARILSLSEQNQELSSTLALQNTEIERMGNEQPLAAVAIPMDDTALRELEAGFDGEVTRLRELQTGFEAEVVRLQQQIVVLQQRQNRDNTELNLEWKILEAQYLLGIANQKLQLEADLVGARALLESADAALVDSGSNSVFPVRQAIAADQQLLSTIEPVDREGIYLSLETLIRQVESIDLIESMRESFAGRRNADSAAMQTTGESGGIVDAGLDFLGSIFVWRKWDDTPVTMLAPGQENFIKQNLRLMLEQAQLALLLRDNVLFQRSLHNGIEWLRRYSAPESSAAQKLSTGLNELLNLDINPPLPSLEQSLVSISQLTASNR